MSGADKKKLLRQAYGDLYIDVSRLVREADPIGLIAMGAPSDEYDPEVSTILPRLRDATSADDLQRIIHEEFVYWFSTEVAGPLEVYTVLSAKIWFSWQATQLS